VSRLGYEICLVWPSDAHQTGIPYIRKRFLGIFSQWRMPILDIMVWIYISRLFVKLLARKVELSKKSM